MNNLTDFNKYYIYECYTLMRDCVDFEHIQDSEYICSIFRNIEQIRIAIPPELYEQINDFIIESLHPIVDNPDFFSETYSPEYGSLNKEGSFQVNSEDSLFKIIAIVMQISIDMEQKVDTFAEQYIMPYLF